MALINMKLSKEEAREYTSADVSDAPKYSYGLAIDLDDDAIDKLGVEDLEVGDVVNVQAKAKVTSKSGRENLLGDSENSLCLQITDMEVGPASALYDKA